MISVMAMPDCNQCLCYSFVAVVAYVVYILYQVGEFSILYPLNVRNCRRIEGYHGCEDFAVFSSALSDSGYDIYMSCDDRSWLGYQWLQSQNLSQRIASQKDQGNFYLLPHGSYDEAKPVRVEGYNAADFHPLGVSSLEENNQKWLYATNNRRDGQKVEVFEIMSDSDGDVMRHYKTIGFDNDWIHSGMLNDLTVVPSTDGSFYITNWMTGEPGTLSVFLEVYARLPKTFVLFCHPKSKGFLSGNYADDSKEVQFTCRRVADGLRMANGITRSNVAPYSRIYVAETTARQMNIYERDTATNDLTLIKQVSTGVGCDNIEMAPNSNEIYLGCHPKSLTFQFHAHSPKKVAAPSRIIRYKDTDSESDKMEIILESIGELLMASSLGLKVDDQLLLGSVHDDAYLICDDFHH